MSGGDYRDTVFLPKTSFPMRGRLPEREPAMLARWATQDIETRRGQVAAGRPRFTLHDGPPYANGHLHMGHVLNKVLKDVVNRARWAQGFDARYRPGWDCHGLPIEWKIEEQVRAEGQDKDDVPILAFRKRCRDFAAHWIGVQSEEFQRLGLVGDWSGRYATMDFSAEAAIVRELHKFALNGALYRGLRPVLWSTAEKTALADAEVEYHDFTSDTIHVRFPIAKASDPALDGADVVIWTTTPWTMAGNRAIAYGTEIDYALARGPDGARYLLAADLVDAAAGAADMALTVEKTLPGAALAGAVARHPLFEQGYDHAVPLLAGDFVTTEQGTGLVHVAPGHGMEDFELGRAHGVDPAFTVGEDGVFMEHVPVFAGRTVYDRDGKKGDANASVIAALDAAGRLFARAKLNHTYPHSWRSKAPLIFRATAQWFVSMDANGLREKALKAIADTDFHPEAGRRRLQSMVETRPDWCVSRQRAWGVPIAIFARESDGAVLQDAAVYERVAQAFEAEGGDAWWTQDPARFLGPDHDPAEWLPVRDILDVWFDSGSTHAFVLEDDPEQIWPASLYLEGSDQHRGWFQSSLLEACGARGRAPYEAVLTHGFLLAEDGRKMSKSLGNGVEPADALKDYGADVMRLWVVSSDFTEDLQVGPSILKQTADSYRRFRNTLRYLLGALDGFTEAERLTDPAAFPPLERYMRDRLARVDAAVRAALDVYDLHGAFRALYDFANGDLSSFYFDIRKDALYCDRPDSDRRRACRTVMDEIFERFVRWLAPMLAFTAEEALLARRDPSAADPIDAATEDSAHLATFLDTPAAWRDDALAARWDRARALRRVVTGALEVKRAEKFIGSSLEARPILYAPAEALATLDGLDFADVCIVSDIALSAAAPPAGAFTLDDQPGVGVVVEKAEGLKCARSRRVGPDVGSVAGFSDLSPRDADAVAWMRAQAA